MSVFDDLDKTEDFVMFKGERIDMCAPELTEATLVLRQTTAAVEELPEGSTEEQQAERNVRVSVELVKSAIVLTVPRVVNGQMAAKLIQKTGGMAGKVAIKAVELCGWESFYMYTVNREDKEKEDE